MSGGRGPSRATPGAGTPSRDAGCQVAEQTTVAHGVVVVNRARRTALLALALTPIPFGNLPSDDRGLQPREGGLGIGQTRKNEVDISRGGTNSSVNGSNSCVGIST